MEVKKEIETFEDYLEIRYKGQRDYYDSKSVKNKKKYNRIQWALIILSTLTTLLAAFPSSINTPLGSFEPHYIVVITAALVAILTSALNTFQYQELWANYRSTNELLTPEKYRYLFNVDDYQGKTEEEKKIIFVKNVETILGNEHTNWAAIKKSNASSAQSQNDDAQNKLKDSISSQTAISREDITDTKQPAQVTGQIPPDEPLGKADEVTDEDKHDETDYI